MDLGARIASDRAREIKKAEIHRLLLWLSTRDASSQHLAASPPPCPPRDLNPATLAGGKEAKRCLSSQRNRQRIRKCKGRRSLERSV